MPKAIPAPQDLTDPPEERGQRHLTLAGLVAGLKAFEKSAIPEMERRIEFARTARQRTLEEPIEAWQRAVASIADPSVRAARALQ